MNLTVPHPLRAAPPIAGASLAAIMLGLTLAAALLAGWTPILFSIATVFLFAGPHNWLEARYFLTRLPARWGKLRPFFLFAFGGLFALCAGSWALPWLGQWFGWTESAFATAVAVWNSLFIGWIAVLIQMRMRQNPRRDWGWTLPVVFLVLAANWLAPFLFSYSLVYLHPLMALWLLDRELKRTRPEWRPAYHACLLAVPALLCLLWWKLHDAPPLPTLNEVDSAITNHAGAGVFGGVSSHFLVAAQTFLEMVHYGVWVIAIPLIGLRTAPWRLGNVPMARRGASWRLGIMCVLAVGLVIMLLLWAYFGQNYAATRYVYFQVALLHVLAEVPFLLRAL
jgi:hypothetical protein